VAIDTRDKVAAALGNSAQTLLLNKASVATQGTGGFSSLWRATGIPGQAAIPGAAAVCNKSLTGAFAFANPTGGALSYLGQAFINAANASMTFMLHDRLAHMGGLVGNVATSQTANVDVSGSSDNLANRRGASDYSNVEWWLEIYTSIGTTAVTATVTYTNAAGTSGRTTTLSFGGASPLNQAGRMFPIIGQGGEFIRSVQSVQLSATTGTAGSFGVTATRRRAAIKTGPAFLSEERDWGLLGLAQIHDDSCLFHIAICGTTSTGAVYGGYTLIQG
jgi:hypothetical protein